MDSQPWIGRSSYPRLTSTSRADIKKMRRACLRDSDGAPSMPTTKIQYFISVNCLSNHTSTISTSEHNPNPKYEGRGVGVGVHTVIVQTYYPCNQLNTNQQSCKATAPQSRQEVVLHLCDSCTIWEMKKGGGANEPSRFGNYRQMWHREEGFRILGESSRHALKALASALLSMQLTTSR